MCCSQHAAGVDRTLSIGTMAESGSQLKAVNMGRYPKWNPPKKYARSYSVCYFHKWSARCGQEYNKHICRWYEAIPCSPENWRLHYPATRPRLTHKLNPRFHEARCKGLHLGNSNQKLEYQMETETLGNTKIEKDLMKNWSSMSPRQ